MTAIEPLERDYQRDFVGSFLSLAIAGESKYIQELAGWFEPKFLSDPFCRQIYRSVLTAHEHKAPITASDLARTMLEAGERWDVPPAYLAEMIHEFEHLWMHARFYAEKAHDLWRRNATSGEANSAASFVRRPDIDVDDVLEDLGELRNRYAPPPHLRVESTQAALDAIRDGTSEEDFLPTGWKSIDERFNQRTPGSATIVGGRPSAGKSSVMGHLCMVDSTSCKCSFFTLEMTNQELLERWVKWLMAPPTRLSKESAVEYLRQLDIDVHAGSWDIKDIEKQVISLAVHQPEERPVSVFVDYLQLIGNDDPSERTRHDKVQAISRRLKSLALKTGVILTVGSQLNRQADDKTRPRLAHLRESGALEQDADNVILIWDDPKDAKRERVEIPLLFDKVRQGARFEARLNWSKPDYKYTDLAYAREIEDDDF